MADSVFLRSGFVFRACAENPEAWAAVNRALDLGRELARDAGHDWPHCMFGEAAELLPERSLPSEFVRYAAPFIWVQVEARA